MADFSGKMQEWGGSFRAASPVETTSSTSAWETTMAKLLPGIIEGVGKGYAAAKGENILGTSTTAVEAEEAVKAFGEESQAQEGMTNAQIADLKDKALKKFGTNDKKIQALVSAGKISTIEANARRHAMLQENLSNPVLAMFKDEFVDAATPFTGGSGKLSEQYFGAYLPTEEERIQLDFQKEAVDNAVAKRSAIDALQKGYGLSPEQAEEYYHEQQRMEADVKAAEQKFKMLGYESEFTYQDSMSVVRAFQDNIMSGIVGKVASGAKFDANTVPAISAQIDAAYTAHMQKLMEYGSKMKREDYNAAVQQLNNEVKRAKDLVGSADSLKALQNAVSYQQGNISLLTGKSVLAFTKAAPEMAGAFAIGEKFGEFYINLERGDYDAEYQRLTNSRFRVMVDSLRGVNMRDTMRGAYNKLTPTGGGKLSATEEVGVALSLNQQGSSKALLDLSAKSGAKVMDGIKQAFSNRNTELSVLSNSDEWKVAMNAPEGAKIGAAAIRGKVEDLRGMQFVKGGIPSEFKMTKEIDVDMASGAESPKYRISSGKVKIDEIVQKEAVQVYKILEACPSVTKELGYTDIDSAMNGLFGSGKTKKKEDTKK